MAIGVFSIIASIINWDAFFNSSKAGIFLKLFGRNGSRIFYFLLGTTIFSIGLLSILNIIE